MPSSSNQAIVFFVNGKKVWKISFYLIYVLNIRGKYLDADYERAQLGVVQKQIISRILKLSISSYSVQNLADER